MKITLEFIILIAISLYCIKMLVMNSEHFTCIGSDSSDNETCDVFYSDDTNISVDSDNRIIIDNKADENHLLCEDGKDCSININDVTTFTRTETDNAVSMSQGTISFIDTDDAKVATIDLNTTDNVLNIQGKETCNANGNCTYDKVNIDATNLCLSNDGLSTLCFIPQNS